MWACVDNANMNKPANMNANSNASNSNANATASNTWTIQSVMLRAVPGAAPTLAGFLVAVPVTLSSPLWDGDTITKLRNSYNSADDQKRIGQKSYSSVDHRRMASTGAA
jgi:hypothetical protein